MSHMVLRNRHKRTKKKYEKAFITCNKKCSKYKELTKQRFKCLNDCEKEFKKTKKKKTKKKKTKKERSKKRSKSRR